MYSYTLLTWMIANLLHPVLFLIVPGGEGWGTMGDIIGFIILFIFYSILFSIPSLLLGFFFINRLFRIKTTSMKKYIAWLIAAPVIVFINYWLLFSVIFGITLGKGDFEIMIPAMIAVVLTILVRYPAFYRLAAQLKNKEDERNMV